MPTLSIVIITKNEANRISQCLKAASFADEIIVVDSGSTDNTVEIALQYTPKVYHEPWQGFGAQKNIAIAKATSDWVLSLDADEIISPALQDEINTVIRSNPKHEAYYIPRKSYYCDQLIRFGDWKNDKCLRLFRNGVGKFKDVAVHEELIVAGSKGKLKNFLIHHTLLKVEEVIEKMNQYSTLGAQAKFAAGKRSSLSKAVARSFWTFFRGYFIKLGFLDGKRGFMLAVSNSQGCYYRYIKMMLLEEQGAKTYTQ